MCSVNLSAWTDVYEYCTTPIILGVLEMMKRNEMKEMDNHEI